MSNFSLKINRVIQTFNGSLYHMINVKITIVEGRFMLNSLEPFIRATNGAAAVDAFIAQVSGNRKEINGCFTTDAFDGFDSFTVTFGVDDEVMGSFENVDETAFLPLNPIYADVTAPDASNAWLETILIS